MWKFYPYVAAVFVFLLSWACGEEYLSQDERYAEYQHAEWWVVTYGKTPTAEDCHVKAVRNYIDHQESLTGELKEIIERLYDLILRGINDPELPESDPEWFIEYGGIAKELTVWMETYGEMKVPIPMYDWHDYHLQSYAFEMKWHTDVVTWLLDENRTKESLGYTLTREDEWGPKANQAWLSYLGMCGDVWDE